MLVWRIQNAEEKGPYNADHIYHADLREAHNGCPSHPVPYCDGIQIYSERANGDIWLSGFKSLSQLNQWFDGWVDRLRIVGFSIVRYKVSAEFVEKGKFQLTFSKQNSELVPYKRPR